MSWRHLDTGPGESAWNMALDEALLDAVVSLNFPILRFYSWRESAATFGYFQRYNEIAAWTPLRPLIRRPTGGGLVPHDIDWTYSVIVPPSDPWHELRATESYLRLHQWLAAALRAAGIPAELAPVAQKEIPGQCFAGAEQHDILLNGRKIAGAAQRRARHGLLIQGSVQKFPAGANRALWQSAMLDTASSQFQARWENWILPADILAAAEKLAAEKFSQSFYNQKR